MKKTFLFLIVSLAIIAAIAFTITSCSMFGLSSDDDDDDTGEDPVNGSLTVNLTNGVQDDEFYAYLYPEGTSLFEANDPANLLATNNGVVAADGTCSFVLMEDDGNWMPTATTWTGSGGTSYDVYVYTDPNGDGDYDPGTGTGGKQLDPYPYVITINGDKEMNTDYNNYIAYPANGSLTVNLTNGVEDDEFYAYVYPEGTSSVDVNNPDYLVATNNGVVAADGSCSFILEEDDGSWMPTGTNWTGSGGVSYDVYVYTDPNDDGDYEPGTGTGAKQMNPFPYVLTVDGDGTIDADYSTFEDYSY